MPNRFLSPISALLFGLASFTGLLHAADEDAPTHVEISPLKIDLGNDGKIETMAMDNRGNLLVGISWAGDANSSPRRAPSRLESTKKRGPADRTDSKRKPAPAETDPNRKYAIKVVSSEGVVVNTLMLKDMPPKMIHGCDDGTMYISGGGKLIKTDASGKVQKTLLIDRVLNGKFKGAHASGMTACDKYVFIALGEGRSLRATEDIVRLNRDLTSPRLIAERQFGCCSHIDLDVSGEVLLIAENSRHRVNRLSFDGKLLERWGRRDRTGIEGFAACCNPVNFDMHSDGTLYTAESGVGRVKRYSPEGKFLGMVGYVDTTEFDRGSRLASISCYIPVEVSPDAKRIFVMDVRTNFIRVLLANDAVVPAEARYVFAQLDKNKDGNVSRAEWQSSKGTRQGFEKADAKLSLPCNRDQFVQAYPKERIFPQLPVDQLK